MRHLATIREIASLRPIAGADRIEVAQVDGWECVVQKGEFHTGEHKVDPSDRENSLSCIVPYAAEKVITKL